MSTHPNVVLMAVLTPDKTSRKTMREILAAEHPDLDPNKPDSYDPVTLASYDDVVIGERKFHSVVMESEYDDNWQVSAKEGDLVFLDLITYGYGETIEWSKLEAIKAALETWAMATSTTHNCQYRIEVTANYW